MPDDVEWFDQALAKLVEEHLGEEHKNMVDYVAERYFVDFLRDAPEATGTTESDYIEIYIYIFKRFSQFCDLLSCFSSQGKNQKTQTLICPKCTSLLNHLRL